MLRLAPWLLVVAATSGCASASRFVVRGTLARPFDVLVVPGCPSNEDGTVSLCQKARALAAADLWQRGQVARVIVSGAAVHNRYVEAEAMAIVMAAAGVPADRIYLEREALHTDENMYLSLRIARALGARTLAVVSSLGHAAWSCEMMASWGQACGAYGVDLEAVKARDRALGAALEGLRTKAESPWLPLDERERRRAREVGRVRRPPSALLYPMLAIMRTNDEAWTPPVPTGATALVTWAAIEGVHGTGVAAAPRPGAPR